MATRNTMINIATQVVAQHRQAVAGNPTNSQDTLPAGQLAPCNFWEYLIEKLIIVYCVAIGQAQSTGSHLVHTLGKGWGHGNAPSL